MRAISPHLMHGVDKRYFGAKRFEIYKWRTIVTSMRQPDCEPDYDRGRVCGGDGSNRMQCK